MHNMTKLEDVQLNLVCGGMSSILSDIAAFVFSGAAIIGILMSFTRKKDTEQYDEEEARMSRVHRNRFSLKRNSQRGIAG